MTKIANYPAGVSREAFEDLVDAQPEVLAVVNGEVYFRSSNLPVLSRWPAPEFFNDLNPGGDGCRNLLASS